MWAHQACRQTLQLHTAARTYQTSSLRKRLLPSSWIRLGRQRLRIMRVELLLSTVNTTCVFKSINKDWLAWTGLHRREKEKTPGHRRRYRCYCCRGRSVDINPAAETRITDYLLLLHACDQLLLHTIDNDVAGLFVLVIFCFEVYPHNGLAF